MVWTFPLYNASASQRLRTGTRDDVRTALVELRDRTLSVLEGYRAALGANQLSVPQLPELNPPLWEWGHIAWFQEFWLARNQQRSLGTACDVAHQRAPSLLPGADRWYNSSEVAHDSRWQLNLPDLEATQAYLHSTQLQTLNLLDALPLQANDNDLYFFRLVALHEAMHAEAAVHMAQLLGIVLCAASHPNHREQRGAVVRAEGLQLAAQTCSFAAQTCSIGSPATGFAFDNELSVHAVQLPAFAIDAAPLRWSRYLPFIEVGGYRDAQWWTAQGWAWLQGTGLQAPRYLRWQTHWEQQMFGQWDRLNPVAYASHLSLHEAQAWCCWAGRRLPSEAEWECAARSSPDFVWGGVWEWTASPFAAYRGFAAHPYRDYSQPWFGTHQVLRGACAATSSWLVDPCYRNFFQAGRNDIAAGLRSCGPIQV
jgi:gamma-glutamyl hercynylcysteine S-oxide synthase